MERKIGEVFDYKFNQLKVYEDIDDEGCGACFFDTTHFCNKDFRIAGVCCESSRNDEKNIIFKIEK